MKQAIYKNYYYEVPYHVGISCTGWVPKSNGELLVDYKLSVPRQSYKGILIGEKGRIIKGVREEVQAELSKIYQKPVVVFTSIVIEKNYAIPSVISRDA